MKKGKTPGSGITADSPDNKKPTHFPEFKENEFELIYQSSADPIFLLSVEEDSRFRFISINKAWLKATGLNSEQVINKDIAEVIPEAALPLVTGKYKKAILSKETVQWEEISKYPSGIKTGIVSITPVFDENGICTKLVGTVHDITERKRAEELQAESEARLRTILQTDPECIKLLNKQGILLEINPAGMAMLEADNSTQVLGKPVFAFIDPDYRDAIKHLIKEVFKGNAGKLEFEITGLKGTHRWLETHVVPFKDAAGNISSCLGISRDITDQKQSQQIIRESEEKYRHLFNYSPMPKWIYDLETFKILEVNEAAIKHYGYTREEFLNKTIADIRPAEDMEAFLKLDRNKDRSGTLRFGEWRHKKANGDIINVEVAGHPINYNGRPSMMVLSNDITERKKAEENLARRAEELAASNAELERFAYVTSHDLQEPLRMVSSFLQLLEKKYRNLLDETGSKYIHFAVDGADRMKSLIQDLLEYSRVGTNKESKGNTDMNEVTAEVIKIMNEKIVELNAVVKVAPLPVLLNTSRTQMLQLMQNLLSNALKYHREERPEIAINVEEKSDHWVFSMEDNGLGIEQRFLEKIFIIFQRLHNKTEYSGTGIGLSICKKIVERHGGHIWVQSTPGKGSTFYFSISKK